LIAAPSHRLVKMGATDLDKAMALQGGGQPEAAATAVEVKQEALSAEEQAKQALVRVNRQHPTPAAIPRRRALWRRG
jgi:hypothetical protein